ncbi:MAG TPA: LacI family DNA-binding transcriptional regulator [Thermotogota bacterium]|nr:LacI family DNA-binding transcriptional regulator [Thermotogota bacterium]HRW92108.1 LacI family DNA-binding transcriptional regulator [Thermotogota bacterium]
MANISDVAKLADVSVGTVSKVLNGDSSVKEKNRLKVLQSMKELGYHPNLHARNLSSGKTGLISVILPTIGHEFNGRLVNALDSVFRSKQLDTVVFPLLSQERLRRLGDPFHLLYHTDGMVIASLFPGVFGKHGVLLQKPAVLVDTCEEGFDSFFIDNHRGGQLAGEKLFLFPQPRVFVVGGLETDPEFSSGAFSDRLNGFVEAMEFRGMERDTMRFLPVPLDWNQGYDAAKQVFSSCANPSVFCLSDILAAGFLAAANQLGKTPGEDFCLVGFDNLSSSEKLGVATVAQPVEEMGEQAANWLVQRLFHPNDSQPIVHRALQPAYIQRQSNREETFA